MSVILVPFFWSIFGSAVDHSHHAVAVDHSHHAVTSATYLARGIGGTVGVTAASAVYQNVLTTQLWRRFGEESDAAEEIRRIRNSLEALKSLPMGWYDGVMDSFMEAFRAVWLTLLGVAVLALACISLVRRHTLHESLGRC
ncbi:hypothetical protein HRG_013717 [Hirsutella rhossiliensis]